MSGVAERLRSALADRYAIERELGVGGMATVYLAEDLKHHRRVALKVLHPELAAALGTDRFLNEIRVAAQLNHPHILPLHDSGEAGGFLFYVMPAVEGESLRQRLDRAGPFPVEEAVRLARQIAAALEYAHRRGLIHRDIKPENVLLHEGEAVVTDFGIALAVDQAAGARLTHTGLTVGTPLYMSPEQAAGEPVLDARSDVYSLGCVLFEMLTGEVPLAAESIVAVLARRIAESPPDVSTLRAGVPADLSRALSRALARFPAERYPSAAAFDAALAQAAAPVGAARRRTRPGVAAGVFIVALMAFVVAVYVAMIGLGLPDWVLRAALGIVIVGVPIIATTAIAERARMVSPAGRPSGRIRWLTWERVARAGSLAFAALGLVTASFMGLRAMGIGPAGTLMTKGVLDARDPILLAAFDNQTPDSTLAAAITESLRIDLLQSRVVQLVQPAAIVAALERMRLGPGTRLGEELARQVGEREGLKAILVGEVRPLGRGYLLSARLISPADGALLAAERATADDETRLIAAIDQLSARLRERIGESLRSVRASPPLHRVTTTSLPALRKYTEAMGTAGFAEGQMAGVRLLQEATALDSTFAMAYRSLAAFLFRIGRFEDSNNALRRAYALRDRLPEVERHIVSASYHGSVDYDGAEIESAYRAALALDPDNTVALTNLAVYYGERRLWAARESLATRAFELGGGLIPFLNVFSAQLLQGKYAEAEETLANVERLGARPMVGRRFDLEAARRDYDAAERALRQDPAITEARRLGLLLRLRGRMREAEDVFRRNASTMPPRSTGRFDALHNAATLLADQGAVPAAIHLLEQFPADSLAPLDRHHLERAEFLAGAGRPDQARALIAEFEQLIEDRVRQHPRTQLQLLRVKGEIALSEGRFADAARDFSGVNDLSGQCTTCGLARLALAWLGAGQPDSAVAVYERMLSAHTNGLSEDDARWLPESHVRLAELYEARNDSSNAIRHYSAFLNLWQGADAALQSQVTDVRRRIATLVPDRGARN